MRLTPTQSVHRPLAMHRLPAFATLCAAATLASCANYQFDQARLADGSWDVPKLVQDLEASEEDSLYDGIWIPLIYTDFTVFTAEDAEIPGGYTLGELSSYGPLFLGGSASLHIYNPEQTAVERQAAWWALWGVGAVASEERIQTVSGERIESRWRALLVFEDDDLRYVTPEQARETPVGAGPTEL